MRGANMSMTGHELKLLACDGFVGEKRLRPRITNSHQTSPRTTRNQAQQNTKVSCP
jgi:hypothetical protein